MNNCTEIFFSWLMVFSAFPFPPLPMTYFLDCRCSLCTSFSFFLLILHPFLIYLLLLQGLDSVSFIHSLPNFLYKNKIARFNQINNKLPNCYNKNKTFNAI